MMTSGESITLQAPAKINLALRVVGKRDDGYHLLQMIMVPLAFGDTVTVALQPARAGIAFACDDAQIPTGPDNICYRAAQAMLRATGRRDGIHMALSKRTPMAAGLGGGSSDAAAVLRALSQLWGLDWGADQLSEVGLTLGADVPFFCWGRPAVVEGIGERITLMEEFPKIPILLVNPNIYVSTKEVFHKGEFDLTPENLGASGMHPKFETLSDVVKVLTNDLEMVTTVQYPVIGEIKEALIQAGATAALMSGSGPTVFGVFDNMERRNRAADELRSSGWWICPTEVVGVATTSHRSADAMFSWGVAKW